MRGGWHGWHWWRWCIWLLGLCWLALAQAAPAVAQEADDPATLQVFVRQGCPHCAAAKAYLDTGALGGQVPVVLRWVDEDPAARDDLLRISQAAGVWPPGVPTFVYQHRVMVGFADAATSGPALAQLVAGVPQPIDDRSLPVSLDTLGLPLFTLAMGLIDGFNPCAMWVLLFLLSLLVHLRDRWRMALVAGTFVAVSGAVYYAFMAAWLNVFLAVGLSSSVRVGLALLALVFAAIHIKDYWVGRQGVTLSIPDRAKPGLYASMRAVVQAPSVPLALLGVATLAVAVNFIELLCTAGLPALYTAVLTQQSLPPAAHYAYLGLYILGYVADDSLMVGMAVYALGHHKLSDTAGRRLKLLSGVVMAALGLVMLLRPQWLS